MVVPVADSRKSLGTKLALVRSLTGMSSAVDLQVASFVEALAALVTLEVLPVLLLDCLGGVAHVLPLGP